MLQVTGGPAILNDITITLGYLSPGIGSYSAGININGGTLTLNNSTISNNEAAYGGGLACQKGCILTINSSTISDNTASFGGGVFCEGGCSLTINNSTISSNEATIAGGGISDSSGANTMNINNSTISNNTAPAGTGGGLDLYGGTTTTTIKNSIIANSITTAIDCFRANGTLISDGYNLVEAPDATCSFAATGDVTSQDPNLGSLAENGGGTQTHALITGSPAIDQIADGTNGCDAGTSLDQRGAVRAGQVNPGDHRGGTSCDIGAYEYDSVETPTAITLRSFGAYVGDRTWFYLATILAVLSAAAVIRRRKVK
jgi:hypothetical protein